jgi:hypothetical protein
MAVYNVSVNRWCCKNCGGSHVDFVGGLTTGSAQENSGELPRVDIDAASAFCRLNNSFIIPILTTVTPSLHSGHLYFRRLGPKGAC